MKQTPLVGGIHSVASVFFGYPQRPKNIAEVFQTTATALQQLNKITGVLWEQLDVDGRVVISRVLEAINNANMSIFDVTTMNENVLFECGYAIARAKPIWITLDETNSFAKKNWNEFALLKPIGFTGYKNSDDLVQFFSDRDHLNTHTPVYDDIIEPILPSSVEPKQTLLYCPTFEPFEASNRLSKLIDSKHKRGMTVVVSDPRESSLNPLTWYAPIILKSAGVLIHFAGPERNLSNIHNRRYALVAGMAVGFGVPVLMLAEDNYIASLDYETMLHKHESADECISVAREWIDDLTFERINWRTPRKSLKSALSGLRFGEHVAENELSELTDYFIETSAFEEVVGARDTIFVGHRGTGKTANAMQALDLLAANKTNMAVLIKPPGFEFPPLLAVISALPEFQRDYFFDTLWRFVIQTEIAKSILNTIENRPSGVPADVPEMEFLKYINTAPFDIKADISIRLEQSLRHLAEITATNNESEATRNLINEAFHSTALVELRHHLGPVLKNKNRVAIFVDNLDKGWERGADFKILARLILGLLTARGYLITDFQKHDYWRENIKLTISIFLRSDIFNYLRNEAREPDKLPISMIVWRDRQILLGVLEARFLTNNGGAAKIEDLWIRYFCEEVRGVPTRLYLTDIVLPRPRDIVYFCNAAVGRAIDRRHDRVEEDDFLAAEETYSQFAYEALLVENGVSIPELEDALLAFLDAPSILTRAEILERFSDIGLSDNQSHGAFEKLVAMFFIGPEIHRNEFVHPEVGSELKRAFVQATNLQPDVSNQRFVIHQAFHKFLNIKNPKHISAHSTWQQKSS